MITKYFNDNPEAKFLEVEAHTEDDVKKAVSEARKLDFIAVCVYHLRVPPYCTVIIERRLDHA